MSQLRIEVIKQRQVCEKLEGVLKKFCSERKSVWYEFGMRTCMKLIMMRSNRVDFTTSENLIGKGTVFPHCNILNALGYLQIGTPTISSITS
jgi:hypothetical protein